MKPLCAALCAVLLCASVGEADVRYAAHVEVRRTARADRANIPDLGAIIQTMTAPGDTVTYVRADAVRIEQSNGATKLVVLLRPDGQFVLDPVARTYVRVAELGDVFKGADSVDLPTFKRTGEFATILGIRAERIEFTMSVPLPITPPPGFPTVVTMKGEVWLGNPPGNHAAGLRRANGVAKMLPAGLEGMVLRQVMRNDEFGYEVETTMTELAQASIPAEMFNVPADYREQRSGSPRWR